MAKPRKRFNPRKQVGRAAGAGEFARRMALASTLRLPADRQDMAAVAMRAALLSMHDQYSPIAFNRVSHFYRVGRIIANELGIPLLSSACDSAWQVLNDLYDSADNRPVPTAEQYRALGLLIDALEVLLPELPEPLWDLAEATSQENLLQRMTDQYVKQPAWARSAAVAVLAGKTVKALAATLGRPESEVSEHVRVVGAILYTLNDDSTLPFPGNVTQLRRLRPQLLPVAVRHEHAIANLLPQEILISGGYGQESKQVLSCDRRLEMVQ